MSKVEKMKIKNATEMVISYCSAIDLFRITGRICAPLNNKKQSAKRIINSFKLNHALQRKTRNYGTTFKCWNDILEIFQFLMSNNTTFVEVRINLDSLQEDYEKFLEAVDNLQLEDELFWDRVYVLIGMKKPIFFFLESV